MADLFTILAMFTTAFWAAMGWSEMQRDDADLFDILIFGWHGTVTVLGLALLSNRYL